jgi:lysophospholipase L1-like esterase
MTRPAVIPSVFAGAATAIGGVRSDTAFDPAKYGTVDAYFDATTIAATNGATITTWNDLSGNSRALAQTAGTFTYLSSGTGTGKPAVNMAINSRMQTPAYQQFPSLAGTIFVVSTPKSNANNRQLLGTFPQTSPSWLWYQTNPLGTNKAFMGGNFVGNWRLNVDLLNRPTIQVWRRNGAALRIYDAYTYAGEYTITNSQQTNVRLYLGDTGNGAEAEMSAILVFRESLSDTAIRDVFNGLARKFFGGTSVHVDCCGDSITAGFTSGATPYPVQMESKIGFRFGVYNLGVSGINIASTASAATTGADVFAARAVDKSVFVGFVGSNDINSGVTAATAYAAYRQMFLDRPHTKKVAVTILDRTDFDSTERTRRNEFNALLAAGWQEFAHALARPELVTELSDPNNVTYFPDGVHLSTAGYDVLSTCIGNAVLATGV